MIPGFLRAWGLRDRRWRQVPCPAYRRSGDAAMLEAQALREADEELTELGAESERTIVRIRNGRRD